jgi:hypothetical protein
MKKPTKKQYLCPSEIKDRRDYKTLVTVRTRAGRKEPTSYMTPTQCTTVGLKPASAWTEGPDDAAAVAEILKGGPPPPKKIYRNV